MVSVDVKHHVYLLAITGTTGNKLEVTRVFLCSSTFSNNFVGYSGLSRFHHKVKNPWSWHVNKKLPLITSSQTLTIWQTRWFWRPGSAVMIQDQRQFSHVCFHFLFTLATAKLTTSLTHTHSRQTYSSVLAVFFLFFSSLRRVLRLGLLRHFRSYFWDGLTVQRKALEGLVVEQSVVH